MAELEKTRQALEDERTKLHDSAALRMDSIKSQHAEAVARADAAEQAAPEPPGSPQREPFKPNLKVTSRMDSTVFSPKASRKYKAGSVVSETSSVQRQKGWVAHNTDKSHNVLLKKLAESSTKIVQVRRIILHITLLRASVPDKFRH